MALQIFATVTGAKQGSFKGESSQKGREGKIPVIGFTYGLTTPREPSSGLATGKPMHKPIVFTKEWGSASPQFYTAAYTSELLTTVLFEFLTTGPTGIQAVDHTIKLTNAVIVETDQSVLLPQAGGPVIDSRELHVISLTFQKIEITSVGGGISATDSWNVSV